MLKLYHYKGSPYCWKVRIVLAEKNLKYETIVPENRDSDPEFRKMTPVGKVPVLMLEDGRAIFESTIINEYLEDRYPSPPLLPEDPADRARARMIEEIGDDYLGPALRKVFTARYRYDAGKIYRLASVDRGAETEGMAMAGRYLDFLDKEVEGREWFLGPFTLADVGLTPGITRMGALLDLPLRQKWPRLAGWAERVLARPSVRSTTPDPYTILDSQA